jgi:hypothetical protein
MNVALRFISGMRDGGPQAATRMPVILTVVFTNNSNQATDYTDFTDSVKAINESVKSV